MSRKVEKGINNPFYMARMRAARVNDRLGSRFGASCQTATSEKRLGLIESGLVNPYPEEVLMMSQIYNAPELENYYCSSICPLRAVPAIEKSRSLSEIAISAAILLENAKVMQKEILNIAADNKITEDEAIRVEKILDSFEDMARYKEELEVIAKKNATKK